VFYEKALYLIVLLIFVRRFILLPFIMVDKDGVVNFTDDLSKVPPSYRNRVEKEERKDVKEKMTPQPPQAATREDEQRRSKETITAAMKSGGGKGAPMEGEAEGSHGEI